MTAQEKADLAVLKNQMTITNDDISEVKADVKTILGRLDALDKKYITRDEVNLGKWIIGTLVLLVGAMAGVMSAAKGWLR